MDNNRKDFLRNQIDNYSKEIFKLEDSNNFLKKIFVLKKVEKLYQLYVNEYKGILLEEQNYIDTKNAAWKGQSSLQTTNR